MKKMLTYEKLCSNMLLYKKTLKRRVDKLNFVESFRLVKGNKLPLLKMVLESYS